MLSLKSTEKWACMGCGAIGIYSEGAIKRPCGCGAMARELLWRRKLAEPRSQEEFERLAFYLKARRTRRLETRK